MFNATIMEANNQTQQQQPEAVQRNFAIPGCSTVIHCEQQPGISVEQLLSIVFNLAGANPGATVDFWIKVLPE